jgi:hypothetical protein
MKKMHVRLRHARVVIAVAVVACCADAGRQKASCFERIATGDGVRVVNDGAMLVWFNRHIPKSRLHSLLKVSSLCSAISHGKGGDLIRFLNEAEIPKDKWPSLLAISSLCSAVVHGKGGDLIRFLNDTEIPKDKWPLLL